MAKRMEEQKGRRKNFGKIEIHSDEPVFTCSGKFLIRKSPIASKSSGILRVSGKPDARERRNSKPDAASSSQGRLKVAYFSGLMDTATGKLVATKEESWDVDLSESETWSQEEAVTERPVACKTATGKPNASSKSDRKLKEKDGHTIYTCLCSLLDRQENLRTRTQTTPWMIWTCIWPCAANF